MKKKSKIFVLIIIGVIVAVAAVIYFIASRQIRILDAETVHIKNMNIETDAVDMNLYTTGDYMAVEDYIKTYINEYQERLSEFKDIDGDSELNAMLSADNITQDGPEFTKSTSYLEQKKTDIEALYNELLSMSDIDNIKKMAGNSDSSELIKYLYEREMVDTIGTEIYMTQEELELIKDDNISKLSSIETVINYLKSTAGSWRIEGGVIKFSDDTYLQAYNDLIEHIR